MENNAEIKQAQEKIYKELLPLITPKTKMFSIVDTEYLKQRLKEYSPKNTEIEVNLTSNMDIEIHCKIPMSYKQITIDKEKILKTN